MKWAPGKDDRGKVQTCSDGHPAFYASECHRYTISRAIVDCGVLYDAWLVRKDAKGRRELSLPLGGGLANATEAIKACQSHAAKNAYGAP